MKNNKLNIADLDIILNKLIGTHFKNIIFQPTKGVLENNIMVINFLNEATQYTLSVGCFVRVRKQNNIMLTSSDEFFQKNLAPLNVEKSDTLLQENLKNVNQELLNSTVGSINITPVADLHIQMDCGVILDILPDCLGQNYEHYRFFDNHAGNHYIVYNYNKVICCKCC